MKVVDYDTHLKEIEKAKRDRTREIILLLLAFDKKEEVRMIADTYQEELNKHKVE